MYVYLWRALPGRRPVKIILLVVLLAALVLVLMEVVFPGGRDGCPIRTSPFRASVPTPGREPGPTPGALRTGHPAALRVGNPARLRVHYRCTVISAPSRSESERVCIC